MAEQNMALTIFLLILFVLLYIFLAAIVIIKRHISIRKARSSKAGYTPIGHGLSKNVRDNVEQEINATCKVYVEPKMFTEEYESNFEEFSKRTDITFLYRLKVVEEYKELVPLIVLISSNEKTSKPADLSKETTEVITACQNLYSDARHSYKPFTKGHYEDFSNVKRKLLTICTMKKKDIILMEIQHDDRLLLGPHRSHSVDSIDSQTALIESDQPENHMVADNSNDNLDDHLIDNVRIRYSKNASKRPSDTSSNRTC